MPSLIVDLSIPSHEFIALYRGTKRHVQAVARDGTSIRFAAMNLRPFVTREGVQGSFRIRFDDSYRLIDISRVQ